MSRSVDGVRGISGRADSGANLLLDKALISQRGLRLITEWGAGAVLVPLIAVLLSRHLHQPGEDALTLNVPLHTEEPL